MKIGQKLLMFGFIILSIGCGLAANEVTPWSVTVSKSWAVSLPGMAGFTASADGQRLLVDLEPGAGSTAVVALDGQGKELWRHTATTGKIYAGGITTDGSRGASTEYQVDAQQQKVRTRVTVFSMIDGMVLAAKTYTLPYHGEMDDLVVPVATISPNGKYLLCANPRFRFLEVYEIQADHLQILWSVKEVTPPLPMDGEWEAVSWLPDSSELILSTWRGDYYQISRGGKRGWSLPSISEPERGGATISTAPTGNVLTVWGNSPAKEWIGNPSAVQPNFDRIEGIETAQAQVGFHLVSIDRVTNDTPIIKTVRGLAWLGSDWGDLQRVNAIKQDREILAVLLFTRQPMLAQLPISSEETPATTVSTITPLSNLQGGGAVSVAWALGHSLLATVSPVPVEDNTAHTQLAFYNYAGKQLWSTELPEEPASPEDGALYFTPYGRFVYVGTIAPDGGTITKFTLDK